MKFRANTRNVLLITITAILGLAAFVYLEVRSLPDVSLLKNYQPVRPIQIYDRNDRLIISVESAGHHKLVALEDIPNHTKDAILAAEDHHFFQHRGIDVLATMRALFADVSAGKVVEGGSTLTQQLAKNLYFGKAERTLNRKIKEAILALELETYYSKEQILQMYLSQVYFGEGAYGIEQASQKYFAKHAFELTLAESAFLAGLVREPSVLGAPENRDLAFERQREILDKMVKYNFASRNEAELAKQERLSFATPSPPAGKYPYYVAYVFELLAKEFGKEQMWHMGLSVYTNLDQIAQTTAERVLQVAVKHAPAGITEEALVSVNVQDGAVVALVGGAGDYVKHQWNCAVSPHTVGSAFKPFVYLAAFQKGTLNPDSTIYDEPLSIAMGGKTYRPRNFDDKFLGPISCRAAIALSRNICAVKAAQVAGIGNVIQAARACGITAKLEPDLSLALGSCAISPLEMAGAYATFARNGGYIKPQVIRFIKDDEDNVYPQATTLPSFVFAPNPISELVDCLQAVVAEGTGRQAALYDRPVAGKTGTADQHKDIWFVGFTPDLATAVWAGNDQDLPIAGSQVTGGQVTATIWRQYNQAYYQAHPTESGSFATSTKPVHEQSGILHSLFGLHTHHEHRTAKHEGFFHKLGHWLLNL